MAFEEWTCTIRGACYSWTLIHVYFKFDLDVSNCLPNLKTGGINFGMELETRIDHTLLQVSGSTNAGYRHALGSRILPHN